MRRIRRPSRIGRRRFFRRNIDNPKSTMMFEIENFPKGSEFTAKDYIVAHPDNLNSEEVDNILNDLINKNNIDLSVREENGIKIYTKTKDSLMPIYTTVGDILESQGDFSDEYIIREDLPYSMCHKIKDEVVNNLLSLGLIKKISDNQYFIVSDKINPKYNIITVLLKALDMPENTEWTLSDVLGEKPDIEVVKEFEALLYNDYDSINFSIYKKGFNSNGEMVYTIGSGDEIDNLKPFDVNSILEIN